MEALSELGDPAGFRLELGAELPEGRTTRGLIGWRGGEGKGNSQGRE